MPPVRTRAHAPLDSDSAVDKLYRKTPFPDDAARVAFFVRAVWKEKTEGLLAVKQKRGTPICHE